MLPEVPRRGLQLTVRRTRPRPRLGPPPYQHSATTSLQFDGFPFTTVGQCTWPSRERARGKHSPAGSTPSALSLTCMLPGKLLALAYVQLMRQFIYGTKNGGTRLDPTTSCRSRRPPPRSVPHHLSGATPSPPSVLVLGKRVKRKPPSTANRTHTLRRKVPFCLIRKWCP